MTVHGTTVTLFMEMELLRDPPVAVAFSSPVLEEVALRVKEAPPTVRLFTEVAPSHLK